MSFATVPFPLVSTATMARGTNQPHLRRTDNIESLWWDSVHSGTMRVDTTGRDDHRGSGSTTTSPASPKSRRVEHVTPSPTHIVRKKKSSYDLRDEFHHGEFLHSAARKASDRDGGTGKLGDVRQPLTSELQPSVISNKKFIRRHSE